MKYRKLMPWARMLTLVSAMVALMATIYISVPTQPSSGAKTRRCTGKNS